jgi:hypothetical protein
MNIRDEIKKLEEIKIGRMAVNPRARSQYHKLDEVRQETKVLKMIAEKLEALEKSKQLLEGENNVL